MLSNFWIRKLFTRNPVRPITHRLSLDRLEERITPAVTNLTAGVLAIDFSATSEALTVSNDGTNVALTSTAAIAGGGATFSTAGVTRIVVTDSGTLAGQSLTFAAGTAFTLSGGLSSTGVETVTFNNAVTATGSSSIAVTAPQSVTVNANLSGGGGITLSANQQATASAGNFTGIFINSGRTVQSANAAVTLSGRGGTDAGGIQHGVENLGTIATTGTGAVSIRGTGGPTGNDNDGVRNAGTISATGGGSIQIIGSAPASASSEAFANQAGAAVTASGGVGTVSIVADVVFIDATSSVSAGTQTVTLAQNTAGQAIDIGTKTTGSLGLTDAELDRITAGTLVIGSATAGTITVSAAVSPANAGTLSLVSGASIGDSGPGLITANRLGLTAVTGIGTSANLLNTAVANFEATTGTGGIFVANTGVLTIGGVDAVLAGVSVTGATGAIQVVSSSTLTVNERVQAPGDVTLQANGAASDVILQHGTFDGVRSVSGTTTLAAGRNLLAGTAAGGLGDARGQTLVLNAGGDIVVDGTTYLLTDGAGGLTATAGGDFKILQTFGAGSVVNANGGGAAISITTGAGRSVTIDQGSNSGIGANGGNIALNTDDVVLTSGAIGTTARVTIATVTAGRTIDLGTNTVGSLGLTDAELDRVTAGTLVVGSATAGVITSSATISPANAPTLHLITGANVIDGNGGANNIVATGLAVSSATGVDLDIVVSNLAATNSTSGAIDFNDVVVGTPLTIGTVDSVVGINNAGGAVSVVNREATITVNENVTSAGDLTIRTLETSGAGQDLIVAANTTISGTGFVTVRGGDNVTFNTGSSIVGGSVLVGVIFLDGQGTFDFSGASIVAGSDVEITSEQNATLGAVTAAGTVSIRINNTGSILDGNGAATNIAAAALGIRFNNAGSLGSFANPIETRVSNFELDTSNNGAFAVANDSASLELGGVSPAASVGPLAGVRIGFGGFVLTNTGSIGVTTPGDTVFVDGTVSLTGSSIAIGTSIATDNGNQVILNATSGGITSTNGTALDIITTGIARLTAATAIGTSAAPIDLSVLALSTNTASGNGAQFLRELDTLNVDAADLVAGTGTVTLSGGTFLTTAAGLIPGPVVVASGATLGGVGSTGAATVQSGGSISPGNSPGILNTGDLALVAGSTFVAEVNGNVAGTQYDQVRVTGTVSLGGATLATSGTIASSPGQTIVLIDNDGTDAVVGTFAGLAEGAIVTINSSGFRLSYVGGTGNDVTLTQAASNVFLDGAGNLVFADGLNVADNLTISFDGTNYTIANTGQRLFTKIAGATGDNTNVVIVPASAVTGTQLIIDAAGADDTIATGTIAGNLPIGLTINGGSGSDLVNLNGDATFASDRSLVVNADDVFVTASVDLAVSGTGAIRLFADRTIVLATDSSLSTVDGEIRLEANLQATPAVGSYVGIELNQATIQSTGLGDITLIGRGGNDIDGQQYGVWIHLGSLIGGGAGSLVTITGTGGASAADDNYGVFIDGDGLVVVPDPVITSAGGIAITGTGGGINASSSNFGILIDEFSQVIGTGTGAITLTGTGGTTAGDTNRGIVLSSAPLLTTNNADIILTGVMGSGSNSTGILNTVGSIRLFANGNGNITFITDSYEVGAGTIEAIDNTVTFVPFTSTLGIVIGGADAANFLGLFDGELDLIEAGTLVIGDGTNTGEVTVIESVNSGWVRNTTVQAGGNASITFVGNTIIVTNGAVAKLLLDPLGTGAILSGTGIDVEGADVYLTAGSGGIGTIANPFSVLANNLSTRSRNADQFLRAADVGTPIVILPSDLDAGTGTITFAAGTFLTVNGGDILSDVSVANGATLGGSGTTAAVSVLSGGTVAPGNSPGILTSGDIAFDAGSNFTVEVNGATAGTQHDRLNVTGTVSLGGATLATSGTVTSNPGQTIVLIANDGTDAVVGTFAGLPENGFLAINGVTFVVSYVGGTGNDVVLKQAAAPAITSANATTFSRGAMGSFTVIATGFPAPTLSLTGALPTGVTFAPATGLLSGTPTQSGVFNLSFTAANGISPNATQTFALTVSDAPAITSANAASGKVGDAFSFAVTATGFPAPTVSVVGLPSGLSFDAATKSISGTPTASGDFDVQVVASNGVSPAATQNLRISVAALPVPTPPTPPPAPLPEPVPPSPVRMTAVGVGAGGTPQVVVYNADGSVRFSFLAYDAGFRGGVTVATGDVDGDGTDDIVTGAGSGGGPHVKVFDGATGRLLVEYFAYDAGFGGGVSVATADTDGDGRSEVVTGAGAGGGPHVRVFGGTSARLINEFFAYDPASRGGIAVAGVDIDGDGRSEVVTGAGAGGGPHVRVFAANGRLLNEFFAYDPQFLGGVSVAGGDLDGDGRAEIVTGAGAGEGASPHVRVFSSAGELVSESFAYDPAFRGGVRVAVTGGRLVTGAGIGGGPHVRRTSLGAGVQEQFYVTDMNFLGGVFVG